MSISRTGLVLAPCSAALLLLLLAPPARAQPGPPPPPPGADFRKGLNIGFGVGGGSMSCETVGDTGGESVCDATIDEAGSIEFHIGLMIRPRLSLNGEIWVMGHTENNLTITNAITTIGATLWLMPRLWVRGGVGGAVARWDYKGPLIEVGDKTESVPAVMGAIGFEAYSKPHFAIDVELRGGTGFYKEDQAKSHNVALAAGFTWY